MRFSKALFIVTLITFVAAGAVLSHKSGVTSEPLFQAHVASHNITISRRFFDDELASDADWSKYINKGGALMCALEGSDLAAGGLIGDRRNPPSGASVWIGDLKQQMRDWYWHDTTPSAHGCEFDTFWNLKATFRALGLSAKAKSAGGDNVCYKTVHWNADQNGPDGDRLPIILQWYQSGEKQFQATGSEHEFAVNTKGGAIVGLYHDSPKSAASRNWYGNKKDPVPEQLPHLHALSDMLWGYWNRDNPNVKNINYFMMLGISNDETNQIIASCFHKTGKTLSEWPGTSYLTSTNEGHALLGTPNGGVFAYFLLQHKAQLGPKIIAKITILRPESEDSNDFVDASLIFHVADAPSPPPDAHIEETRKRRDKGIVDVMQQGKNNIIRTHKFEM